MIRKIALVISVLFLTINISCNKEKVELFKGIYSGDLLNNSEKYYYGFSCKNKVETILGVKCEMYICGCYGKVTSISFIPYSSKEFKKNFEVYMDIELKENVAYEKGQLLIGYHGFRTELITHPRFFIADKNLSILEVSTLSGVLRLDCL